MFDDFLSSVTWSFNPSQNAVNELTEELKITVARRFDWVVDDPRVVFTLQQAVWIVWERMISRVHERPFLTRVAFDNIRVTDFSARQRRTMTMIRDADMPPERSLLDTFKQYLNIAKNLCVDDAVLKWSGWARDLSEQGLSACTTRLEMFVRRVERGTEILVLTDLTKWTSFFRSVQRTRAAHARF